MKQTNTSKEVTITTDMKTMMQIALLKSLLSRKIINQPTYKKTLDKLLSYKEAA